MGMSPEAKIWVGFQNQGVINQFVSEDEWDELSEDGKLDIQELTFREFHVADEPVGFGVELLSLHSYEIVELDLAALFAKSKELLDQVVAISKARGVEDLPKVFALTNYS